MTAKSGMPVPRFFECGRLYARSLTTVLMLSHVKSISLCVILLSLPFWSMVVLIILHLFRA
jgi:hypothetical protein